MPKLPNNTHLPTLDPYELLDLSTISNENSITHISVYVHVPTVGRLSYNFLKFVPLPKLYGNEVKVLDENMKYYFVNETNHINVLSDAYSNTCTGFTDYTMCSPLEYEFMEKPNPCLSSILVNDDTNCSYTKMDFHNYTTDWTPERVYYSIHYLITLQMDCGNMTKFYNLTESESQEINFTHQCELTKVVNKLQWDANTYMTYQIDQHSIRPNPTIYDSTTFTR